MSEFKKILIASAVIVASLIISFALGCNHARKGANLPQTERVDTLFIFDTMVVEKPVFVDRVKLQKVPVPVVETDTLWRHDTLFVYLQKEQVIWQDQFARVYASGINPQVDSVQHFIKERIVTIEKTIPVKKPCRWGIGINAGYGGVVHNGQISLSPYIGVGVTYNLLSW